MDVSDLTWTYFALPRDEFGAHFRSRRTGEDRGCEATACDSVRLLPSLSFVALSFFDNYSNTLLWRPPT